VPFVRGRRLIGSFAGQTTLQESDSRAAGVITTSQYRESSTGFEFLGSDDPADPQNTVAPVLLARFPLEVGERWQQYDERGLTLGTDLDGDGEVVDLESERSLGAFEDVIVEAGTFHDCARFDTSSVTTLRFTGPLRRSRSRAATGSRPARAGPHDRRSSPAPPSIPSSRPEQLAPSDRGRRPRHPPWTTRWPPTPWVTPT
jgi:hypothetical protein